MLTGTVDLLHSVNIAAPQLGVKREVGYCESRGESGLEGETQGPDVAYTISPEAALSVTSSQVFPRKYCSNQSHERLNFCVLASKISLHHLNINGLT